MGEESEPRVEAMQELCGVRRTPGRGERTPWRTDLSRSSTTIRRHTWLLNRKSSVAYRGGACGLSDCLKKESRSWASKKHFALFTRREDTRTFRGVYEKVIEDPLDDRRRCRSKRAQTPRRTDPTLEGRMKDATFRRWAQEGARALGCD